ncbi:hypothetical protein [Nocardioides sp. SYSU D00038]|uniref:hypothetical protein n=1 Tax=Nocardioides sp. SYSU D00038 TaxID=2812554 RepID=UPI001966F6EB|nr:hypothetical protein [Nocardioides sp. SYSU D00038]
MNQRVIGISRGVAAVLAFAMATYFATDNFGGEPVRTWDNAFLVPDLLIVVLLGVSALLPLRLARPALMFSLAWGAAVWTTSLSHWFVEGEYGRGVGHLFFIGPAVIAAALLARERPVDPRGHSSGAVSDHSASNNA